VSLSGLAAGGGDVSVSEANLEEGSAADAAALTQPGNFTFASADGVASVQVGNQSLTLGDLQGLSADSPVVVDTEYGSLSLTGFTPSDSANPAAGGTVSYSYTLDTRVDNDSQADATDAGFTETVGLVVTDDDGSAANGSLSIAIADDSPSASNDSDTIAEETASVSGNVLGNDTTGADTTEADPASVALDAPTGAGQYGTLTLNSDGSYTYQLDNDDPRVQALSGTETLTETFAYTLTDADGDTSPATLTITLTGTNDGVSLSGLAAGGSDVSVSEANLAGGSDADSGELTQLGSFTFASADGVQSVQVGNQSLSLAQLQGLSADSPVVVDTEYGSLSLTGFAGDAAGGTVSYSYTLDTRVDNDSQDGADINGFTETVALVVTDDDGSAANGSLSIAIADDSPSASNDSDTIAEETASVSGNVLSNDTTGADTTDADPASVALDAPTGAGEYGTLTLNSDGSYTYQLDNDDPRVQALSGEEQLTETFAYTLTDADGDTSPATLTITLTGTNDGVSLSGLAAGGGDVSVSEANLEEGSSADAAALTQPGSFTFTSADGVASVQVGNQSLTLGDLQGLSADSPVVVDTEYGSLSLTGFTPSDSANPAAGGTVSYSYTLDTRVDNDSQADATDAGFTETVALVVTDDDDSAANGSLTIAIADDAPDADDDATTTGEDQSVTYNVLVNADGTSDTQGADGASVTDATLRDPSQGSVSFDSDTGEVTFTPAAGFEGDAVIDYTIRDADGDTSDAVFTVTVAADSTPTVSVPDDSPDAEGGQFSVSEAGLPGGSAAGDDSQSTNGSLPITTGGDSLASLVINGQNVTGGGTVEGDYGTLSVSVSDGEYSWSYTLDGSTQDHTSQGTGSDALADLFAIVVTDSDGDTASTSLTIDVNDDVPVAVDDATTTGEDTAVTYNVLVNADGTSDTQGADGASVTDATLRDPSQGSVSFDSDTGEVTFTPAAGFEGDAVIDYTIRDADGDTSDAV
ncbi:VCBS domain-containing protein, partial [Halomonas sp. DP1Y21-3]|uniref:beta strand repeat-containing protein n=1 Tax=Halomonas sp. DP1Y21-3 TaxID=2859080 RepID=UPI001C93907E